MICRIICVAASQLLATATIADDKPPTDDQIEFVENKVLPLLEARCFECHKDASKGGLSLASRKAALAGGESGPALVPGHPDESLLIEAVRYEGYEMPPRSKMPDAEVAILERWVKEGAYWPKHLEASTVAATTAFPLQQRKAEHWAWQPIQEPETPPVRDANWPVGDIDRFVLSGLETQNLKPAADTDRYSFIRRLYLDLIGLPPTIPQVRAFVQDKATDDEAIGKVVDELLASPHFGERWGRHWLDLVRYAETLGHEFDYELPDAWRYRDYVIRAFNADVPYDQLVTEHLAGDLLTNPRRHPIEGYNESIIGTGFWFLGEDKHAPVDVKGEEASRIDNQIDVFSKAFLGMTVACARCHDHKFDAISTADYYAMAGVLQSSRRAKAWLDQGGKIAESLPELKQHHSSASQILHQRLSETATFSLLKDYVETAIQTVKSRPKDEKQHATHLESIAKENHLEAALVTRWVQAIADKSTQDPSSVFSALHALSAKDPDPAIDHWIQRIQQPAPVRETDTTLFAHFESGLPDGWYGRGPLNQSNLQTAESEKLSLRFDGQPRIGAGGLTSASLSDRLPTTIFSPSFELKHPEILIRMAGRNAKVMLVIDGYHMQSYNALLFGDTRKTINTDGKPRWIRLAGDTHRYQGHQVHLEIQDDGDGWFEVMEVRFANQRGAQPPTVSTNPINQRLAKSSPTKDDLLQKWTKAILPAQPDSVRELVNRDLLPGLNSAEEWVAAKHQWQKASGQLPIMPSLIAITDGTPEDEHTFIRGSHKKPGKTVARGILTALKADDWRPHSNSGRLEIARQLFHNDNPLVARVAANRIWHHLMGRGIVDTTDNFGVLGNQPTHPELLDYLAVQLRNGDWSWKSLIREITISRTYRMSCVAEKDSREKDPTNRLWHSAMVKRLSGEAVRDSTLLLSGELNTTAFGPPVPIALTPFMQGRGRPRSSGPIDGNGRRSIYIAVRRNFLSPLMLAFDVPAPVSTMGRRTVSNVPAQALLMLNNDFINDQAKKWAAAICLNEQSSSEDRIRKAWFQAYSRPATDDDVALMLELSGTEVDQERLAELCHILLNSKEFLFVR